MLKVSLLARIDDLLQQLALGDAGILAGRPFGPPRWQPPLKRHARPLQGAVDRRGADIQEPGGFFGRPAQHVPQDERRPLRRREKLNDREERDFDRFAAQHDRFRVGILLRDRLDQGVWNRLKPRNLVGRRWSAVLHRLRGQNGPGASAAAFNSSERCLRDGGPALLFPSPDRGLIEIVQTNTHVVIRQENLHETRVIPLDGRPHVASAIRSWVGDPRGSWNGGVLIVDSTNFTDLGDRFGEHLHLIERFSRIDSETLLYEVTVDDPTVYTRSWTVVMPLMRSGGLLFDDACHEGNYSLPSMLRAVRVQEASR